MKRKIVFFSLGMVVALTFFWTVNASNPILAQQNADQRGLVSNVEELMNRMIPVGAILPFAGTEAPNGYVICDGRELKKEEFPKLYAIIAERWGASATPTMFKVPDLRGRSIFGAGSGPGLTVRSIAEAGGTETHKLTVEELPSHSHSVNDPGHEHELTTTANFGSGGRGVRTTFTGDGQGASRYSTNENVNGAKTGISIGNTGGNIPHNIMPPYAVVNYIIKF